MATAGSIVIDLLMKTGAFETDAKRAEKRMQEMGKAAKRAGVAIGAAMAGAATALAASTKNAIDWADEMSKTAQKIGITTEALSTLSYAAELADVDIGQLQAGLGRLIRFQDEAAQGTERNIEVFESLGVEFENLDGTLRDAGDVFKDFARATEDMTGPDKAALALEVFGRAGADLIPLLNTGADGIEKLEERARRLGLELSTGAGKDAEELNDRLSDLWSVFEGLSLTIATDLVPDIIKITDALADTIREGGGMVEVGRDIADIFRGIGNIAAGASNSIEMMGNRLAALGEVKNILLDPMGADTYTANIERYLAENERLTQENHQLALRARQQLGIDPSPIRWIDPPAPRGGGNRRRGTPMQDGESVLIRPTDSQREQWGADLQQGSNRAAAEAARAAEEAARALEEQIRRAAAAQADFLGTTEDLRAELGGPLAQVQLDYIRREDELIGLAELAGLSQNELTASLNLLEQARLRDVEAIEKQIEAQKAYEQALKDAPLIRQMDQLREATEGFFVDLVKNGEDAIDRLADYLFTAGLESIGRQIAEGMFGDFGTTGEGSRGSWIADIFGSFFGGGRAGGGDVLDGRAYLVGEQGPEMFIPRTAGAVLPAAETAQAMGRGRGISIGGDTIIIQGATSRRSDERRQIEKSRRMRRAVREFG